MSEEFNYKVVVKSLHDTNLLYAFIGELIGSDNNVEESEIAENKKILSRLISSLEEMRADVDCDVPADALDKYLEMAIKSMSVFDEDK